MSEANAAVNTRRRSCQRLLAFASNRVDAQKENDEGSDRQMDADVPAQLNMSTDRGLTNALTPEDRGNPRNGSSGHTGDGPSGRLHTNYRHSMSLRGEAERVSERRAE